MDSERQHSCRHVAERLPFGRSEAMRCMLKRGARLVVSSILLIRLPWGHAGGARHAGIDFSHAKASPIVDCHLQYYQSRRRIRRGVLVSHLRSRLTSEVDRRIARRDRLVTERSNASAVYSRRGWATQRGGCGGVRRCPRPLHTKTCRDSPFSRTVDASSRSRVRTPIRSDGFRQLEGRRAIVPWNEEACLGGMERTSRCIRGLVLWHLEHLPHVSLGPNVFFAIAKAGELASAERTGPIVADLGRDPFVFG